MLALDKQGKEKPLLVGLSGEGVATNPRPRFFALCTVELAGVINCELERNCAAVPGAGGRPGPNTQR